MDDVLHGHTYFQLDSKTKMIFCAGKFAVGNEEGEEAISVS
jgi:hypothetical protein